LKSAVKEKDKQRNVRRIFKILREIWLNIGIEKVDMHKGVIVEAFLDSGVIEMFMDKKMVVKHGFRLQKLERPVMVRNIDGTNNSGGAITHQVEVNVYYKGHVKRIRIDVYNLGRIDIILGMPWLQAHNPKINWETEEIKMTRYPPLCKRNIKSGEGNKMKKGKRVVILEQEKIVRWVIDNKKDWRREEEVEADYRKIEEMVSKRFLKWKKIFGKVELERMPTRKIWNHAIDLKKTFKL